MCLGGGGSPPPPPPLAPPPPPPLPPKAPIPEPERVEREVNPAVRNPQSKSEKEQNPYRTGTEQLTIGVPPTTNNPGTEGSSTGTNI